MLIMFPRSHSVNAKNSLNVAVIINARLGGLSMTNLAYAQNNAAAHQRKHQRIRVLKGARLHFHNKLVSIDCMMRDLSAGGARLRLNGPVGLPDHFDVLLNCSGDSFPARLVWRRGNEAGVAFEKMAA